MKEQQNCGSTPKKPLLSIIVPVYNTEQYLHQCLDSIINSTLINIEIICVNDASTDNSLEILQKYAQNDTRVKVINLKTNKRQGGARNEGIKAAEADWIAFVDSDDFVSTSMFQKLYQKSIETCADIVFCDNYLYYNENDIKVNHAISEEVLSMPKKQRDKILLLNAFSIWAAIYKKNLFIDNKLYFPEHLLYEDNALTYVIHLLAKKISKVNEALYYYRCSNSSATRSFNNYNLFDRLTTSDILKHNIERLGFYETYKEEIDFVYTKLYYINTLYACLTRFSPLPYDKIKTLKRNFYNTLPCFRENKYWHSISKKRRCLIWIAEHNVNLASFILKIRIKTTAIIK